MFGFLLSCYSSHFNVAQRCIRGVRSSRLTGEYGDLNQPDNMKAFVERALKFAEAEAPDKAELRNHVYCKDLKSLELNESDKIGYGGMRCC